MKSDLNKCFLTKQKNISSLFVLSFTKSCLVVCPQSSLPAPHQTFSPFHRTLYRVSFILHLEKQTSYHNIIHVEDGYRSRFHVHACILTCFPQGNVVQMRRTKLKPDASAFLFFFCIFLCLRL